MREVFDLLAPWNAVAGVGSRELRCSDVWFLSLAFAAPLDDNAIHALIVRDGLEREPWGEACCGEGRIERSQVRWAELTGSPPEELVLTMQEYVGEGGAADHHYIYDVAEPAPVPLGKIEHHGYDVFPYLALRDLDDDGVAEVLAVGGRAGDVLSTLSIHKVVGGALVQVGETTSHGQVYLPFDVDGDGTEELVAAAANGEDAKLSVLDRLGQPIPNPPVSMWLPRLFEQTLMASDLERPEDALRLLRKAMEARGLSPRHPATSFESVLDRVAGPSDAAPWVHATWWAGTPEQRERAARLLMRPAVAQNAAMLLLSTPGDRVPAIAWIHDRFRAAAAGHGQLPHDSVLLQLDNVEQRQLCDHLLQLLRAEGDEGAKGTLAFHGLGGPLWCLDASIAMLEGQASRQVVRGAVNAIDMSVFDASAESAVYADRARIAPLLIALLRGDDAGLAAEAARALGQVGAHGDVLRQALAATEHIEVRRSILVSIAELDTPGPAAVYLGALAREQDREVRRRLHAELARMPAPEDVARGLAQVRDGNDYDAYGWRAMSRPESLSVAHRVVYRADAAARLDSPRAQVRRAAVQVLGAVGPGAHAEALRAMAHEDPELYVRTAAADVLGI